MSAVYLLDTNAISEPLRPQPNPLLSQRLHENDGRFAIASVVWHELLYGCRRLPESKRREAIERYLFDVVLPAIPILPYDDRAAHGTPANERVSRHWGTHLLSPMGKSRPLLR